MDSLLIEKTAVVTGAAGGIGLEIAREFAREGAAVIISDVNEQAGKEAAAGLKDEGCEAVSITCDVTNEKQVADMLQTVEKQFGRLDILVNNAGIQHVAPIEEFPTEQFERLIRVMLTAPFIAMKHAFPIMKKHQFGRIINMASVNGLIGFHGKAAYNSAKHGVIGLTKVGALEGAADGITVNALCPGYVDTQLVRNQLKDISATRNVPYERVLEDVIFPLVPQKRLLSVKEIADYAVFLASDKAKGVTGQAVVMDGGYTAQ
ncbi:3-hydroxybutyrate dehydrogenase [Bacillus velezensis]|uniref:3-hydroxybutyrate dehydrogenase n=1 Tax=Bacillus TaxID=1386 RepID=UPI0009881558|nr:MULTISPECIES: 3-hydroxybutyrate dehydrogenase [Bacillus]AQS44319.1 3-hydroxybutyrate dehydrogenase [Bacillus velezensis]MBT0953801.1 3-hydroxybutyrate dehydrogenase [Bacillus velezensis]MCD7912997.1 3-hydroxybutyrate dehydrogenase [Bacillus velezensis]MCX2915817.1 3-hydroxybutyrate dehydrogenase [Bacillus velezensis]MCY6274711.1 3-hydroxybutyrate dehydrogenase [Bacillus sp. NEAU-16]